MKVCQHCATSLLDDARFCHQCGNKVEVLQTVCPECSRVNPPDARFCYHCGTPLQSGFTQALVPRTPIYQLDFSDFPTLPTQLKDAFLKYLADALAADGEAHKIVPYTLAFEESGFRQEVFEEQAVDWTSQFDEYFSEDNSKAFAKIERELQQHFEQAYFMFLVKFAKNIVPVPLSERVLKYENIPLEKIGLHQLFQDYLQLDNEEESYYTQVVEIALPQLENAKESFFQPFQANEMPLIFIDQTFRLTGKNGLLLTPLAMYWKAAFHRPARLAYRELHKIQRFANHLEINGIYLNINPSVNYKLLKLLQKLQKLFANL